MEKEFKIFLIFSILIHLTLGVFAYKIFFTGKIHIDKEETKIIDVRLVQNLKKTTRFTGDKTSAPASASGMKDKITRNIKVDFKALTSYFIKNDQNAVITENKITKNHRKKLVEQTSTRVYDDSEIREPEWHTDSNDSAITFSEGNTRALLDFDITPLKEISYLSNNEVTVDILINSDGYIENAGISISSGDPDNDAKIITIISGWRFEPGEKSQKGKIRLKYFIK